MRLLLWLLAALALLALSYAAARRTGSGWLRYCGIAVTGAPWLALGAAIGVAFAALGLAVESATGARLFHLAPPASAAALPAALAYAALWWPAAEEWVFRGFLLPLFADRWPAGAANLAQAALFGLLHLKNHLGWPHLLAAALFGLLAGWLRLRSRSIWPGALAHVAANGAVLLWYFAAG